MQILLLSVFLIRILILILLLLVNLVALKYQFSIQSFFRSHGKGSFTISSCIAHLPNDSQINLNLGNPLQIPGDSRKPERDDFIPAMMTVHPYGNFKIPLDNHLEGAIVELSGSGNLDIYAPNREMVTSTFESKATFA